MSDTLLLSFDDPSRPLETGSALQAWRMAVRRAGAGDDPYFSVDLYENGDYRATAIPATPVLSPTGQLVEGWWDAGVLLDGMGRGVQAYLVSERGSSGAVVEVASLEWTPSMYRPAAKTPPSRTLAVGGGARRGFSSRSSRVLTAGSGSRSL